MEPSSAEPVAEREAEKEDLFAHEREAHEQFQRDVAGSWEKSVLVAGDGRAIQAGDRVTIHVVGHLHSATGHTYDSSRERGAPLIINANRGSLVPGLDAALLTCNAGDEAVVTVKPAGGYGNRGFVDANAVRKVPGDCTLVFEIEVIKVEDEVELWNMDFETKMRYASEYRERGNTLFRNHHYATADEEYELAMRYLLFNAHPKEEEVPIISEGLVAVHLNLAASRLRTGREKDAISQANKVLELIPNHPKALYRIGQAHVQLGNYREAKHFLDRAMAVSEGDAPSISACQKELDRLAQRQERHKRQRKKMYTKMIQPKRSRFDQINGIFQDPNLSLALSFGVVALAVLAYVFLA